MNYYQWGFCFSCETPTMEPYGISSDYPFSPPKASQRDRTQDLKSLKDLFPTFMVRFYDSGHGPKKPEHVRDCSGFLLKTLFWPVRTMLKPVKYLVYLCSRKDKWFVPVWLFFSLPMNVFSLFVSIFTITRIISHP